eukprot:4955181-Pleurochrysis_carterae.AAC.2
MRACQVENVSSSESCSTPAQARVPNANTLEGKYQHMCGSSPVDKLGRRAWGEACGHGSLGGADDRRERGGQVGAVGDAHAVGEVLEPRLHGEGGAAAVTVALRVVVGDHGGARRVGRNGAGEDVGQVDAGGAALVE